MLKIKKKGCLFILSAPSGAGKSTLCAMALKDFSNLVYSISCTTRQPRPGERDKKDYFFLKEADFKKKIRQNRFLEWAVVHEHYYGTPRDFVREKVTAGKDLILDIDVVGGLNIKRKMPESVLIFILPPSMRELEKRLRNRKQDATSTIALRMRNAIKEIQHLSKYDYLIVNDDLGSAYFELKAIMQAEKNSTARFNPKETIKALTGGVH